jgi:hypothetical protein
MQCELVICFSQMFRQPVEAALPVRPPPGDPIFSGLKGRWIDAARAHAPCLFGPDEAARFEYLQMLDDCRQGHGEGLGELGDRCRPDAETLHHHPAGRDRQGLKEEIERCLLVKH